MPEDKRIFPYDLLPSTVQEFLFDSGLSDLSAISVTYGLKPDAEDVLDDIQLEVIFGYATIGQVEDLIKQRLSYDGRLARNVAHALIRKRFLPIDAYLDSSAFRAFSQLGGDTTIEPVKRIDNQGITVSLVKQQVDVRKQQDLQNARERAKEAEAMRAYEESQEQVSSDPSTQSKQAAPVIAPAKEVAPTVNSQEGKPISAAPELDPSHELAPPAPAVVQLPPASKAKNQIATEEGRKALETLVKDDTDGATLLGDLKQGDTKAPKGLENPKIDEVKRKLHLTFASMEVEKRFRVLLGSRLSGLRTAEAFKEGLTRSVDQGGLAFDDHTAMRIVEAVEAEISGKTISASAKLQEEKEAFVRKQSEKYGDVSPQVPPMAPKPPVVPPKMRVQMEDVRRPRTLVGPMQEIERMSLEDFRRIPGGLEDAVQAIRDDVEELARQDESMRIRAIKAWRSSPLMKRYQAVISCALKEGITVEQCVKKDEHAQLGVTVEEIVAIRELNASLQY